MLLLGCVFAFGVAAAPRFSLDSKRWVSVWTGETSSRRSWAKARRRLATAASKHRASRTWAPGGGQRPDADKEVPWGGS